MLCFVNTVEFYVIAFAAAIAIVVLLMRPEEKGEARTFLSWGGMRPASGGENSVEIGSDGYGRLRVVHRNAALDTFCCEVNCVITVVGKDIKITEKRTDSGIVELNPHTADILFECSEPLNGRFHIYFESAWSGLWASGYVRIPSDSTKTLTLHS